MSAKKLSERITSYLSSGGFFNPELANHDAVRDLLIDVRAYLDAWPKDLDKARMLELAEKIGYSDCYREPVWGPQADALRRLSELAHEREKRRVEIWADNYGCFHVVAETGYVNPNSGLRKVGEAEIDA